MRQTYPLRCSIPGVTRIMGVWTGGGAAAAMSKATADHSGGIASVAYNAATGKYLVTFTDVGQQILWASAEVTGLTGTAAVKGKVIRASYSRSAKTVPVEFYKHDGTLIDILSTEKVMFIFDVASYPPNS